MILSALLRKGAAALAEVGIEGAARDARLLLAAALDLPADRIALHLSDPVEPAAEARFRGLLERRAGREPVSRILGRRAFHDHDFAVSPDTLDPRPETEVLVRLALEGPVTRCLDLGTGTGAIALSILAARPGATGVATDISEAALAVAAANARALGLAGRCSFLRSDWFARVEGRFDLVVSNPPYIALDEMAGLAAEVRGHDPRIALTDEGDGLSAYRAIAARAGAHLAPGGRLLVEIGPTQGAAVAALVAAAGLDDVAVHPDLDGRDRVVSARAPST